MSLREKKISLNSVKAREHGNWALSLGLGLAGVHIKLAQQDLGFDPWAWKPKTESQLDFSFFLFYPAQAILS